MSVASTAWQTPRKLKLLFTAALLMLFANSLTQWVLLQRQIQQQHQIDETTIIQEMLAQILAFLVDAETGERGFIITGEETYLEPYNNATRVIPIQMERLHDLMMD